MPIYEYRCEKGHTFEVMQRISEDALTVCPEHGAPVQRVFHPVAVHFKGSGFYNTDYGKKKSGAGASSDGKGEGGKGEGGSSPSSSTQDGTKPEKGHSSSTSTSSGSSSSD
jgi:putative FmdB family regulatory protein